MGGQQVAFTGGNVRLLHMIDSAISGEGRRRLIVTADDFGLDESVNEAVERAWRDGILTAAGLMVGAPAAADAVDRARRMHGLGTGLHVVLTDGKPVLPACEVDFLTDSQGSFLDNMAVAGVRFFVDPRVRRQLAKEIRAQFEAFKRTGLPLDHVSAHKHFHLHPTVLGLIIDIGREYGMKAVRLPLEANGPRGLIPWVKLMRRRLIGAELRYNDRVFGLVKTGQLDEARVAEYVANLADGVTEIYFHPASRLGITPAMAGYRHVDELAALLSPRVSAAIRDASIDLIAFGDIAKTRFEAG